MLIDVTESQLATIVNSLERTPCESDDDFAEIRDIISILMFRANFTEGSRPNLKEVIVPEISNDNIKVLWEEYQNGFLRLSEYADAISTVSKIAKLSRQVESNAENACMLYNNLSNDVRLLLNRS